MEQGEPAAGARGPYLGGPAPDPTTYEELLLGFVRTAAKAGLGSADNLLDLTPYQLLRLLGWKPTVQRTSGNARLLELRGMLA